jgi:putative PEP-CTERM system TPR-repeat lipoprotein
MTVRLFALAAAGFLTLALAMGGCQGDPSVARNVRYQRAVELLDQAKPQAAVVELKAAIEIDKQWAPAHRKLGEVYLSLGKVENALAAFNDAATLDPENLEILLDITECEIQLDRLNAARQHLERYSKRVGSTARVDRLLGEIANREGDKEAAKAHFEAAVESDPSSADSHVGLAQLAVEANDLTAATAQLEAAAEADPKDLKVQYGLAEVAIRMGDLGRANDILDHIGELDQQQVLNRLLKVENLIRLGENDAALDQATRITSDYPKLSRGHFLRGFLLLAKGELPAATEALTRATALNDNDASAHFYLGTTLLAQGQAEQARAHLARARELRPDFPLGQAILAEAMIAVGDGSAALSTATALVAEHPDVPMAQLALADATAAAGSTDAAVHKLQQIVAAHPDWPEPLLHLARLQRHLGRAKEALALYARQLEKTPERLPLRLEYGDLLVAQQQWDQVLATADDGLKLSPDAPALHSLKGVALAGLGQRDAAKAELRNVLAAHPEQTNAAVTLAQLHLAENNSAAAIDVLRRATAADPTAQRPRALLARVLASQGKDEEAIRLLEEAVKKDASAPDLANLVILYLRAGKNDSAIRTARRLHAAYPNLAAAHLLLVQALAKAGDPQEAIVESQSLVDRYPDSPQALNLHAALQVITGDPEAAITTWDRSLRAHPDQVAVHIDLARQLLKLGRADDARKHADEVVQALPDNAASYLLLGRVLETQGDHDGAASAYAKGQALQPKDPQVLAEVANFYLRGHHLDDAEAAFLRILDIDPKFEPALLRTAMIAERQQRYDLAAERYNRLLAAYPKNLVGLNNLSWLLSEELGRPEDAIARAEAANDLRPGQWWILDTWSWALAKAGRYEEALRRLDEAQQLRPDVPVLDYHRGVILSDQGDAVGAVVALNRALKTSSEFAEAPAARALLDKLKDSAGTAAAGPK